MSFWAIVFLGNCPSGQMSSGQMSFRANVFLGKGLLGKRRLGKWLLWANVILNKCHLGKRPSGQTLYGQMSLGKCLWANVVGANVMEPIKRATFPTPTAAAGMTENGTPLNPSYLYIIESANLH
jgi:hypothetical protein